MTTRIDIEARCDVGCSKANNEDMLLIDGELVRDRALGRRLVLEGAARRAVLAVADGMGGSADGARASEQALDRLRSCWRPLPDDLTPSELEDVLKTWAAETHRDLRAASPDTSQRPGMGTTVVALVFYAERVYRCHAGDSRLYRWRGGRLERLTRDHSLREQQQDDSLPANVLCNSLGAGDTSWLEFAPIDELAAFDRFLLCSDGLHALVDDARIAGALGADAETAADMLLKLARAEGGNDNISILIADPGDLPSQGSATS